MQFSGGRNALRNGSSSRGRSGPTGSVFAKRFDTNGMGEVMVMNNMGRNLRQRPVMSFLVSPGLVRR